MLSELYIHLSLVPALALEELFQSQAPDKPFRLRGTSELQLARIHFV
jgi:hypothetical protein